MAWNILHVSPQQARLSLILPCRYLQMQREQYLEREQAAIKIQQRARGMKERAAVKKLQEEGQLPGQLRQSGKQSDEEALEAAEEPPPAAETGWTHPCLGPKTSLGCGVLTRH